MQYLGGIDHGECCNQVACDLLESLAAEFWDAAADRRETAARKKELDALRRRAALRLVPQPKMGFEDVYFLAREQARQEDLP